MKKEDIIFNKIIEMTYSLSEELEERKIDLVSFVIFNSIFNPDILNCPEISSRVDVLVDTTNIMNSILDSISILSLRSYKEDDINSLGSYYVDALKIDNLCFDYDSYYALLLNYYYCLIEHSHIHLLDDSTYEDCIDTIIEHFISLANEECNIEITREEEMKIRAQDKHLIKLRKEYLKKIEK